MISILNYSIMETFKDCTNIYLVNICVQSFISMSIFTYLEYVIIILENENYSIYSRRDILRIKRER